MSRFALGVDIGGTKIAVGAIDEGGAVQARRTVATDVEAGFDAGLARLARAIDETMAEAGVDPTALAGIGLGCPGPFDEASGRIENFYTLPGWEGDDIVSPLVARFGTPVRLVNDADAALLGEALSGAARGVRIAVMLTDRHRHRRRGADRWRDPARRRRRTSRDRPPDRRSGRPGLLLRKPGLPRGVRRRAGARPCRRRVRLCRRRGRLRRGRVRRGAGPGDHRPQRRRDGDGGLEPHPHIPARGVS